MEYAEEGLGENGQDRLITTDPVTEEEKGQRADVFLAARLDLTRSNVQHDLAEGRVTRQGKAVKANYKVKTGDVFQVLIPPAVTLEAVPQNIPLDILYEDEDVIVINKPRGMVVHPAAGNPDGTLVNALLYHCHDLSGINGVVRPGIVHRLDKDTSGVMIAAKNDLAHLSLSQQIQSKEAKRTYLAIVRGNIKEDQGHIETQLDRDPKDRKKMAVNHSSGRPAVTHWTVLERFPGYTHIQCRLETGRTHQIRVHLASIGHPLLGDVVYGAKKPVPGLAGQCLHARRLSFVHPRTGERVTVECPLPAYFTQVLTKLRHLV